MRDNSRYRRASQMRAGLLPGRKFTGSGRNNSNTGGRAKTPEYKSELFKKVESLEKDNKQLIKDVGELKDIVKEKVINGHFVEEDVIVDVNFLLGRESIK